MSLHNQDLSKVTYAEMGLDRRVCSNASRLSGKPCRAHLSGIPSSREQNRTPFWNEGLRICGVARQTKRVSGLLTPGRQGVGDWSALLVSMTHAGHFSLAHFET